MMFYDVILKKIRPGSCRNHYKYNTAIGRSSIR